MQQSLKSDQRTILKPIAYGLSIFLLVCLLILQILPFAAIQYAKYEFSLQGEGYGLQVGDWHWSPWRGELEVVKVVLQHPTLAAADLTNQKLANSELARKELDGTEFAFTEKSELASFRIQFDPWQLINGQVQVNDISISGLQLALHLNNPLEQKNQTNIHLLGLDLPLPQSTEQSSGSPEAERAPMAISINKIAILDSHVNWQQDATDIQAAHSGKLALTNIQMGPFDNQDSQAMQVNMALSIHEFMLVEKANEERQFSLQQPLTMQISGQLLDVNAQPKWQGDLFISQIDLQLPDKTQLALEKLNFSELAINLNEQEQLNVAMKNLELEGLAIKRNDYALLSLGRYQVSDVRFKPLEIVTGLMAYEKLHIDINRLANGSLQGFSKITESDQLEKSNEKSVEDSTSGAESEKLTDNSVESSMIFSMDIASLMQQGDISDVSINDASVTPSYIGNLKIKKMSISPIKINSQGNADSMDMSAVFSLDEYNEFNILALLSLQIQENGDWYPQGEIQFHVDQLDMVPFNGYLAKSMGYHLEKGMLKLSGKVDIKNAKLKGDIDILLRNSRFVPEDEAIIASMSKRISMPVDMALDLLRDSNGNVKLNIPISGDLSNPDFGAGDVSSQLSELVLQNAALHYLKLSLQPYGLFLSLAAYAGSELMAIRLDALTYVPFQYELTEQHKEKLQNIVEIMTKKTSLELHVCPFSSEIEVNELAEKWQELATSRGAKIKAWLADKQDQNEKPLSQRITLCKPQKSNKTEVVLGFN